MTDSEKQRKYWAIGDLHLSIGLDADKQKPMDQFGEQWAQHTAKIARAWCERVEKNDVVLLVGDLFWGNRVEEARFALNWLGCLPGQKILVRGNHDNWWQSITKVRKVLPEGMYAIQNDCIDIDGVAIAGARGWTFSDPEGPAHQEKMLRREYKRLDASLAQVPEDARYRIAMMHFPPFTDDGLSVEVSSILERHGVNLCVFGHWHGQEAEKYQTFEKNGIKYVLVSADNVDFSPVEIYNDGYIHDLEGNY
ncbi:MAG: metallophosphoesterase [Peptococcaceae bacterium]|nr:metallophosphoesterase [Peptococcaceae bacterium]